MTFILPTGSRSHAAPAPESYARDARAAPGTTVRCLDPDEPSQAQLRPARKQQICGG